MAARKASDKGLDEAIRKAIRAMDKSEELIRRTGALLARTRQILQDEEGFAEPVGGDSDSSGSSST